MNLMKKLVYVLCLVAFLGVVSGCSEEGTAEKAGKKIDQAMEDAKDKMDDMGEDAKSAFDEMKEKAQEALEK